MSYIHLTIEERTSIAHLHKQRKSEAHNIIQFPLEVIQIIEQRIKETWSP